MSALVALFLGSKHHLKLSQNATFFVKCSLSTFIYLIVELPTFIMQEFSSEHKNLMLACYVCHFVDSHMIKIGMWFSCFIKI